MARGEQRLVAVGEEVESLWVGRSASADLELSWDTEVSGLHAQLEIVGLECTLVDRQKRVLVALCHPFRQGAAFATPATNGQIAAELHLSIDAVRAHLRALFEKFGVVELPQNRKRLALVERALQSGLVSERELQL